MKFDRIETTPSGDAFVHFAAENNNLDGRDRVVIFTSQAEAENALEDALTALRRERDSEGTR